MSLPCTRRSALKLAAGTAALPLVHIRTAGAAGHLSVSFWDHWVPGATEVMRRLVGSWADKNKVSVSIEFTAIPTKLMLVAAEEAQARTGHDVMEFLVWGVHQFHPQLEPMDNVMQRLSARYGRISKIMEYMSKAEGHFAAVPACGTNLEPCCARIDLFKQHCGMDLQQIFPAASEMGPGYGDWTWDGFAIAAEKCSKAGFPFGMPMGTTVDSVDWVGSLFASMGAELMDARGEITVNSDEVKAALEWAKRVMRFFPRDVYSWDDASNNRALISGKSALIMNPPSAWAVALRDNRPIGEQCWTFPAPAGPKARLVPINPQFWGVWNFLQEQDGGKGFNRVAVRARTSGSPLQRLAWIQYSRIPEHG